MLLHLSDNGHHKEPFIATHLTILNHHLIIINHYSTTSQTTVFLMRNNALTTIILAIINHDSTITITIISTILTIINW